MTTSDHIDLLDAWELKQNIRAIKADDDYQKLRASLVEKYGEGGVCKVEEKIRKGLGYESDY